MRYRYPCRMSLYIHAIQSVVHASVGGQPPPTAANGTAGSCPHATHVVASGDTCWSLALSYGVTLQALRAANPGLMCEELTPGQQLCLPETAEGRQAAVAVPHCVHVATYVPSVKVLARHGQNDLQICAPC